MTRWQRSRVDEIDDKAKTTEDWVSEVRPASIARRSWSSLTKFLKNPRVLLNLEKSESEKCFSHFVHFSRNKKRKRTSYWSSESVINLTHCCVPEINSFLWYLKWKLNWTQVRMRLVWKIIDNQSYQNIFQTQPRFVNECFACKSEIMPFMSRTIG